MRTIYHDDTGRIRELFMGKSVEKVSDDYYGTGFWIEVQ